MNFTTIPNMPTPSLLRSGAGLSTHALNKVSQTSGVDFSATLKLQLAEMQAQAFTTLMAWPNDAVHDRDAARFESIFSRHKMASNPLDLLQNQTTSGVSPTGRNTALFDPESAYRMMTTINHKDVSYKAEFAEMSAMKSELALMQEEGLKLGHLDATATDDEITTHVQQFADAYNRWIDRFDEELESGGILAGTQAAKVSQWELEQSIENIFHGAHDGVRGLPALGLTTDPVNNRAQFDASNLKSILTSNKSGVLGALREFGAHFSRSAELLISEDNFVDNRLDNLGRAIHFIDTNKVALQAEFGRGDDVKPSGNITSALARYYENLNR